MGFQFVSWTQDTHVSSYRPVSTAGASDSATLSDSPASASLTELQLLSDGDAALVRLLDPPFNHSTPNPGYIQGYLRGVRETPAAERAA
jgi:cellobiose phosphorylase